MGAPYEQAVYAGQVAHEMAAAHFEEEVTSRARERAARLRKAERSS